MRKLFILVLIFIGFIACKTYNENDLNDFDSKIQQFINKQKLKMKKSSSGLYYQVLSLGEGDFIKPTDEVSFTYEGKLLNGDVFDGKHKTDSITYHVKELIMGWQEGLMYIKNKGKIKLIVPPQIGYGDYDLNDIPKNSILVFDLEVKNVR